MSTPELSSNKKAVPLVDKIAMMVQQKEMQEKELISQQVEVQRRQLLWQGI